MLTQFGGFGVWNEWPCFFWIDIQEIIPGRKLGSANKFLLEEVRVVVSYFDELQAKGMCTQRQQSSAGVV